MPRAGLERILFSNGESFNPEPGNAECNADDARNAQIRWLAERWDSLPEDVREEILRMAEASLRC